MTQPTPYARQYSFTSFQTQNPTAPIPAQKLDIELNAVKVTLDQILTNIALLQRDDGKLANSTVGVTQLDGVLISLGFSRPTIWATATAYAVNSAVFQNNILYICLVAHTSGVFATDLASNDWVLAVDFNGMITPVQGYATSAQTYAAAAQASSISAAASFLSMDTRWLGSKASDPIVNNQGGALTGGMGYFNSTSGQFKIYGGSSWFSVAGVGLGYLVNTNNLSDVGSVATTRANINAASLGANTFTGDQAVTGSIAATGNITATGVIQGAAPPGTVLEYYGTTAPSGYLFANGAAVSRTGYAALFAAIGTSCGIGDGSTTFNVPDKRGFIAVGADNMGGSAANKVQVTVNITTVNTSTAATVASAAGLCKGMTIIAAGVPAGATISNIAGTAVTLSIAATAGATVSGRFSMFTDAQAVGAVGGENVHTITVAELASHTHSTTVVGASAGSGAMGNGGAGYNTNSTGSDAPHNNIQPSIICNFIVKT